MPNFSNYDLEFPFAHDIFEKYEVDFHLHGKCEIYFPLSEKVKYFVEKNVYELTRGEMIITNEREIHRPVIEPGQKYEKYTILFSPEQFADFCPEDANPAACFYNRHRGEHNRITLTPETFERVKDLFERIEDTARGKYAGMLRYCLLGELLIEIAHAYELNYPFDSDNEPLLPKNDKMLNAIVEYVSEHLDESLSLDAIAQELYVSKYHLLRTFKSSTGTSLHRFILMRRLERARTMLVEQPDVSISEIAGSCGFGDISNFVEQFKKASNQLTPSVYRRTFGRNPRRDDIGTKKH